MWQLMLPTNEMTAWSRLRTLDAALLQELVAQFALEQLSRDVTDRSQQELLRERLRRLRETRFSAPEE